MWFYSLRQGSHNFIQYILEVLIISFLLYLSYNLFLGKLVVFDLDETLVHCIFNDKDINDADVFLDIKMPNGKIANTGFNIRPYWKELMEEIKKDWEIVVFTASCQNYADAILDYMDPDNEYFNHRFYRETCWKTEEGVYIKDLRVFHQWSLKDIVLVDNAVYSFGFQLDNGIPIFPYIQGKDDKQLLYLKEYLSLIVEKDLIKNLKKTFQMKFMYNIDLAGIYDESEDEDEDDYDILDRIVNDDEFQRIRDGSFSAAPYVPQNFPQSDKNLTNSNKTEEEKVSLQENNDDYFRSHSSNDQINDQNNLIDEREMDQLFDWIQDQRSSDLKAKKKRAGKMSLMMRKNQSVYHKKSEKLDINSDLSPFPLENSSNGGDSSKNVTTPKRGKKKLKKKKLKQMKEYKFGFSHAEENEGLEMEEPKQPSLFKRSSQKEFPAEEYSQDSTSPKRENLISTKSSKTGGSTFKREENLSKDRKSHTKRNSSPLGDHVQDSLLKSSVREAGIRRVSKSSSTSTDPEFDRWEENGISTASDSRYPNSRFSSSDNDQIKTVGLTVSPFGKVDEEKEEKESSPVISRKEGRRDSMSDALDNLQVYFKQNKNKQKRLSAVHSKDRTGCEFGGKWTGFSKTNELSPNDSFKLEWTHWKKKRKTLKNRKSKIVLQQWEKLIDSQDDEVTW